MAAEEISLSSGAVSNAPSEFWRQERSANQGREEIAIGAAFWWFSLTLIFGKNFVYLNFGGLYVTELTMAFAVIMNWHRIDFVDRIVAMIIGAYFFWGFHAGNGFTFVVKDLAWFYYLFFFKISFEHMPDRYLAWLPRVLFISLICSAALSLAPPLIHLFALNKYRQVISIFGLLAYYEVLNPAASFGRIRYLASVVMSFLIKFKTALVIAAVFPALRRVFPKIAAYLTPRKLLLLMISALLVGIWAGLLEKGLNAAVDVANFTVAALGKYNYYANNTAVWRSQIWMQSWDYLVKHNLLLFGNSPGPNFLQYIKDVAGTGDISLNELGVNRSAHNIVIQSISKTGMVGFSIWFLYLLRLAHRQPKILWFYHGIFFIVAMSSDFMEVPERAPVWYVLSGILSMIYLRGTESQDLEKAELL